MKPALDIASKIVTGGQFSDQECNVFKYILGQAASHLITNGDVRDPFVRDAFDQLSECLRALPKYRDVIPNNGISWCGRPSFLNDGLLSELYEESQNARRPFLQENSKLGCAGAVVERLSCSLEFQDLIQNSVGKFRPNPQRAFYLYYDSPMHANEPHIDEDPVNVLIMLNHCYEIAPESTLQLFLQNQTPLDVWLSVGEMVIFFGGSVVHGRTHVGEGERLTTLTIGLRYLNE